MSLETINIMSPVAREATAVSALYKTLSVNCEIARVMDATSMICQAYEIKSAVDLEVIA